MLITSVLESGQRLVLTLCNFFCDTEDVKRLKKINEKNERKNEIVFYRSRYDAQPFRVGAGNSFGISCSVLGDRLVGDRTCDSGSRFGHDAKIIIV